MSKKMYQKKEGLITQMDYKRPSVKVAYWLIFTGLVLLSIIAIFPTIWAFLSGFKDLDEYYAKVQTLLPRSVSFDKIKRIATNLNLGNSVINSLILFAGNWVGDIIIGGIAGYTISRLRPKGSKLFFRIMIWTMLMPSTLSMIPVFLTWIDFPILHLNFQNSYIPLWAGSAANIFHILMFKNYFDGISDSYIEAAQLDGCSPLGIFLRIVIPLSKPIIATLSIFVFNGSWNNFLMPYLLIKDGSLQPVAVKVYATTLSATEPDQLLSAFIVMIPTLIVYAFCSKYIMGGDVSAGVKE